MKIELNRVTGLSQIVAIVLFVGVFCFGIFLGRRVGIYAVIGDKIASVQFQCAESKTIHVVFYKNGVHIALSGGAELYLPQVMSASGIRYAKSSEPIVFWSKGNTAFVTEEDPNVQTYKDCVSQTPSP